MAPLLKVLNRDAYVMDWAQAQGTSEMYLRCALLSGDYEWMHKVRTRLQWGVLLEPQFQSAIASIVKLIKFVARPRWPSGSRSPPEVAAFASSCANRRRVAIGLTAHPQRRSTARDWSVALRENQKYAGFSASKNPASPQFVG